MSDQAKLILVSTLFRSKPRYSITAPKLRTGTVGESEIPLISGVQKLPRSELEPTNRTCIDMTFVFSVTVSPTCRYGIVSL